MSVLFDGAADRAQLAASPATAPTQTTIIAWIKPAAFASRDTIFAHYNSGTDGYHGLYTFTGGKLRFRTPWTSTGVWETPASSITAGAWQAVAVTYDAGSTANDPIFYRKPAGGSFATLSVTELATPSGSFLPSAAQAWIGGVLSTYPFNGRIAYVREFTSILTATQVEAEMDAASHVLAAEFDLPLVSDLLDLSGNSHTATLLGDAALDGDNPSLGGGSLKAQGVAGAITPTGVISSLEAFIASLQGGIVPFGSVLAQKVGVKNAAAAGSITPMGGLVALHIGGGIHTVAVQSGAIVPSGALVAQKVVIVPGSSFLMRFLQTRDC